MCPIVSHARRSMKTRRKISTRIATLLVVFAAVSALAFGCKKSSTDPDDAFSSSGTPGEPTDLDWASLGSQLAAIGTEALKASLPGGATGFTALAGSTPPGAPALGIPPGDVVVGLGFICCGSSGASNLTVSGTLHPGATVNAALTYSSEGPLQWTSGGTTWPLTLTSLSFTSNLTVQGSAVALAQDFRLSGQVGYIVSGQTRNAPISLDLAYQNFESGTPTGSGNVGPVQVSSRALPAIPPPSRCSRPQEGCGPGVSGQCPCTKWPICPVYGIRCGS